MKSDRIRSFSGPYSVEIRENTDQKNSEYAYFSRSASDVKKQKIRSGFPAVRLGAYIPEYYKETKFKPRNLRKIILMIK